MQKIGLVMEGGAMRGLFTAAVLDVFLENGIRLDGACGVSAGATFGCNYLSGQRGRALRYCIRFRRDPRFCSVASLLLTGDMYGGTFCYHTLPEKLDIYDKQAFIENGIPFYVVCTDCETGKAVYKQIKSFDETELEWIRACASMPLAAKIVRAGGRAMLDGGITDSIPLKFMEHKGYAKNVVILTQPLGYRKKPNAMMPAIRKVYTAYPNLIRAAERRHLVYNHQLENVEAARIAGNAFVIRPPMPLPVKRISHNKAKLQAVYQMGRQTALSALPALKAFLAENGITV